MVKIKIKQKNTKKLDLLSPKDMLNTPYGTVFQQYNNEPQNQFYISCGQSEPSVICIWYESGEYKLSTDNLKGLLEFYKHIKVKKVDNVSINIII